MNQLADYVIRLLSLPVEKENQLEEALGKNP